MLATVGGKALNLGRLAAADFPVPPGFCLTTAAYRMPRPRSWTPSPPVLTGPDCALDTMQKAGVPRSSVHHMLSGAELAATLDRVVADVHDLIVVGGGDGTVTSTTARVAGTNVMLGVLPLGTANNFTRTLEIPKNRAEACVAVVEGKVVDIDPGRANGEPFLNAASVGLSMAVAEALSPRLKRRSRPLAYGIATLRAYAGHKAFRARPKFPEGDHEPMELENLPVESSFVKPPPT